MGSNVDLLDCMAYQILVCPQGILTFDSGLLCLPPLLNDVINIHIETKLTFQ